MTQEKLEIWNSFSRPPQSALKEIKGGRLKGMTDINPQWRYKAMTEAFGPCGFGWVYEIIETWKEAGVGPEVMLFAKVALRVKVDDKWSLPIVGIGGSAMVAVESSGPRASDECYKMAITDALSVCLKMLGVGADIYLGQFDGSKYRDEAPTKSSGKPPVEPLEENIEQKLTESIQLAKDAKEIEEQISALQVGDTRKGMELLKKVEAMTQVAPREKRKAMLRDKVKELGWGVSKENGVITFSAPDPLGEGA